jgi:hypothetical protein
MSALRVFSNTELIPGTFSANGLQRFDKRGVSVIQRARGIAKTLGVRCAAVYMRDRGWSVEAAAWAIAGPERGRHATQRAS